MLSIRVDGGWNKGLLHYFPLYIILYNDCGVPGYAFGRPLKWKFIFLSRYRVRGDFVLIYVRQVGGGGGRVAKGEKCEPTFRYTLGEFKLEVLKATDVIYYSSVSC